MHYPTRDPEYKERAAAFTKELEKSQKSLNREQKRKNFKKNRSWFRRNICPYAVKQHDGTCLGYANGDSDEPCKICRACWKIAGREDAN